MSIMPHQKQGIEYLEHCAVRAADDRLSFIRRKDAVELHFNIPNLNTAVLLLGPGTSITQQAARMCAEGNILVGFCGGGGTPIYLAALNEYREPKHSRAWIEMWYDEARRLAAAKTLQLARIELVRKAWVALDELKINPEEACGTFKDRTILARSTEDLLVAEAEFAKALYAILARAVKRPFSRKPRGKDDANEFLDAGNYLAYGLAACTLWCLGIPHSYPLVHGKTRRGALVFDIADLVKDSFIMPHAFISAAKGEPANKARQRMLAALQDGSALQKMFKLVVDLPELTKTGV